MRGVKLNNYFTSAPPPKGAATRYVCVSVLVIIFLKLLCLPRLIYLYMM